MPEVSVIVSLYNQGHYLGQCIRSVLDQSFEDLEVVIVDDASTDGSLEEARTLQREDPARVRVLANRGNLGVSRTRNRGVAEASGAVLAFLDADDYWLPGKLEKQMEAFREDPELGMCHCGVVVDCDERSIRWAAENRNVPAETFAGWTVTFDTFCREASRFSPLDYFDRLTRTNNVCLSSTAVRKSAFNQAGGFSDGRQCQSEDWLLWIKLSMLTTIRSVAQPLTVYRFHPESHTARILMGRDFDFFSVREEVLEAARRFDPVRFEALQSALRSRQEPDGRSNSCFDKAM
jgi:glycosyltransferase involved in cell wall biosynthesis